MRLHLVDSHGMQFLFGVAEDGTIHHVHKFHHTDVNKLDAGWFDIPGFKEAVESVTPPPEGQR